MVNETHAPKYWCYECQEIVCKTCFDKYKIQVYDEDEGSSCEERTFEERVCLSCYKAADKNQ